MIMMTGKKASLEQQVVDTLESRIKLGKIQTGTYLPSFRDLTQEFGVSLGIIQRAVGTLKARKMLVTRQGRGCLVTGKDKKCQISYQFGFVHPFSHETGFFGDIVSMSGYYFGQHDNFLISRSSNGDAKQEREIIERLIQTGVQGIMVWPIAGSKNIDFYEKTAKKLPLVLVDRSLDTLNVSSVIHENRNAIFQLCDYLFNDQKCRKLLLLFDDQPLQSYADFCVNIEKNIIRRYPKAEFTQKKLPFSDIIKRMNKGDFSLADKYSPIIEKMISGGKYDAVFFSQNEIIDYIYIADNMHERFPNLCLACQTAGSFLNHRSRLFNEMSIATLTTQTNKMLQIATKVLQDSIKGTRMINTSTIKIPIQFNVS